MTIDQMDRLEEQLAHQSVLVDALNSVVTAQADQIDILQRRVALLMKRAAEQESDHFSGAAIQDQKPPHW